MTTTHNSSPSIDNFTPGLFTPQAATSPILTRIIAQTVFETKLLLRNLEQLLLTMFIPMIMLVVAILVNFRHIEHPANLYVPTLIGFSIMSSCFTGQAIAVGFDRRYGALKRLGASPQPGWCVIVGKTLAVINAVFVQSLTAVIIGLFLGYAPNFTAVISMIISIIIGTVCFSAMGLLLGGLFKAEIVLALANLMWFVFAGISAFILYGAQQGFLYSLSRFTPPGMLTEAMISSSAGQYNFFAWLILLLWALVFIGLSKRFFSFQ